MDLDEFAGCQHGSHQLAFGAEGGNKCGQDDQARVGHQLGNFTNAPNIFDAIDFSEAEILVQAMAHIVTIEQKAVFAKRIETLLDQIRNGRFARAGQPREPQERRRLMFLFGVRLARDFKRLPVHILTASQGEMQHAGSHRAVAVLINQNEATQIVVRGIGFEDDGLVGGERDDPDGIEV